MSTAIVPGLRDNKKDNNAVLSYGSPKIGQRGTPPAGADPGSSFSHSDSFYSYDAPIEDGHASPESSGTPRSRRNSLGAVSVNSHHSQAPMGIGLRPIIRKFVTSSHKKRRKQHRIVWDDAKTQIVEYHITEEEKLYKQRTTAIRLDDMHQHPAGAAPDVWDA